MKEPNKLTWCLEGAICSTLGAGEWEWLQEDGLMNLETNKSQYGAVWEVEAALGLPECQGGNLVKVG